MQPTFPRFRYRHMSGKELNDRLTGLGMSEREFCKLTGVRERTINAWLDEGGAPPWVRSFLAMASDAEATDRAHEAIRRAIIDEDEYRVLREAQGAL